MRDLVALELVEKAARAAKAAAARQIQVRLGTTTVDGATRVLLTLNRGNHKFTGHGRGRGGPTRGGRPPKRQRGGWLGGSEPKGSLSTVKSGPIQDAAAPSVNFAADDAAAVDLPPEAAAAPATEGAAVELPPEAVAMEFPPEAAAAPAASAAAEAAAEATTVLHTELTTAPATEAAAQAAALPLVGGHITRVAVLEQRGEDAEHEVLLAQCVRAAGSAAQVRDPADGGWRACWVNVAVIVNGSAEDEAIAEAWEAFLRGEETDEASAARCALAREAAEAAAEVDVRRAVAEEGLTLLLTEGVQGHRPSKQRTNFRFVNWASVACPSKPWAVSMYDPATRKQSSHGYYATSWEAALKVARVLGPVKCRELEDQRVAKQVAKAAKAARPAAKVVEAPKAVNAPNAVMAVKATLSPALQHWARSSFPQPLPDLRKWSALQGKPSSASGRWASLGRSRLLADAVREIQRPQCERDVLDAEAWELAAAEGLTLRTSEKASSGFHMVSCTPPPNSSYSARQKWYLARSKVAGCNAAGRLGVFASPAQAALAVARHEAAQHGRAPDAPPASVSTIAGRSHLGVTAVLDCSPRGGGALLRGEAIPVQARQGQSRQGSVETELRVAFLRQRTEDLLQEHNAEVLFVARREAEERVAMDAARAEIGGSGSTRRLMQHRRTEAAQAAEKEAKARLAARPSLEARGLKAAVYEQALVEWRDASAQQELKQSLADEARRELQRQRSEARLRGNSEAAASSSLLGSSASSDRPPRPAAPPAKRQRTGPSGDGASVPPAAATAPDWATLAPDLPHAGLLRIDEHGAIYRVEALLAVRQNPDLPEHRQFLVRWAEYGAEDDTWEDEENIIDKRLIKAYDCTAKAMTKALGKSRARAQQQQQQQQQPDVDIRKPSSAASNARSANGGSRGDEVDLFACLEVELLAQARAAMLGDVTHRPMNAWGFVAESDCGLGLFARVDLTDDQFISEYAGPRLPGRLHKKGSYVLQIPGANEVVIDGASENSPFCCPCSPAIYANHSSAPNARIEMWPMPRPGSLELRQRMVLVATERIAAGREIRINYEHMEGTYWKGAPPVETIWRVLHVTPPPAAREQPVVNRLAELQAAAASGRAVPPCAKPRDHGEGLPWEGEDGGDVRLRVLVPLLATKTYGFGGVLSRISYNWAMVATHLPGRSGRECRDRWLDLMHAAMAEAQADGDSDDDGGERCVVLGCKRQLMRCYGTKEAGSSVGVAEESHVLCVPCLERWFASQNELRREQRLSELVRRTCPVCQAELRAVRGEADFHLGLQKIDWSWE